MGKTGEAVITKLSALAGRSLLLAAVVYAAGRLGMTVPVGVAHVSPVWPPAGVALAALVVYGWRCAPGVWLGAFMIARHAGFPLGVAAALGASNTVEALLSAWVLVKVVHFDRAFHRVVDVIALGVVTSASAALGAGLGGIILSAAGYVSPGALLPTAMLWAVGDAMGSLVVAPVLLTATPSKWSFSNRPVEALCLCAVIVVVSGAVFASATSHGWTFQSQAFLVFPCALWAALRFGPRGAALSSFVVSAIAISGTSYGRGPFADPVPVQGVLVLQMFMATVTLSSLLLAVVSAERNRVQTKLALAERMAAVGTLAAGVAHEVNTPLGFVIANLQGIARRLDLVAASSPSDEALRRGVHDALEGAERIRLIVRDLQTLSRDTGEERTEVDLDGVVRRTLGLASHELRERATVIEELGSPPRVLASEARLGQVVLNLLVNAFDAISPDARTREVRVRSGVDGERVFVELSDTGRGIPADVLPHVFEPFFTTKANAGGTGLGLSISREIVSAYGGEILIDSLEGRGTTVRVVLPQAASTGAHERKGDSPPADAPARREPARGRRVLLVDDEPRFGQSLRMLLEPEYDVAVSTGGEEALKRILSGETFDVILCDLQMPHVSGMSVHATLSDAAPEEADKMIFLSGGAITKEAQDFVDRERHRVLEKPVRLEFLLATLEAATRRAPRGSTA